MLKLKGLCVVVAVARACFPGVFLACGVLLTALKLCAVPCTNALPGVAFAAAVAVEACFLLSHDMASKFRNLSFKYIDKSGFSDPAGVAVKTAVVVAVFLLGRV